MFSATTNRFLAVLIAATTASSAAAVDLIGYLPYYRMSSSYINNVLPGQLSMLDEVRYFGLTVDSNAGIVPLANSLQSHKNNIATIQGVIDALPAAERPRLNVTPVSVDIDWEHPDPGIQRTTHYPALLKRIKQEVGDEHGVYATVAPSVVISNSVFSGPDAIDGASLMTYDLGWWSGDPSNPNNGEHSLQEYAEDAAEAWTEPPGSPNDRPWVFGTWGNGSPADRLGVALPFYGRALSNQAAYTYAELVGGGSTNDGEYYQYFGQQVWTPSPELAAERVEFAHEQGLRHVIIWEIGQDLPTSNSASLLKSAFDAREALVGLPGDYNGDGAVDAADYTVWRDGDSPDSSQAGYEVWRDAYTGVASAASVPEPSIAALLATAVLASAARRPRLPRAR